MSPWKWSIILVVPALGWLLLQLAALEARLENLSGAVARLESRETVVAPMGAGRVIVVQPDGGIAGDGLPAMPSPATLPGSDRPKGAATGAKRDERRILQVVEQERNRIAGRHITFHKQRWMDAREEALAKLAEDAQLSPMQTSRLDTLVRAEVERMAEMLLKPRFRDDPSAFADEWEATLRATDHAVNSLLSAEQQAVWARARHIERVVFFPWLPK
ncbi:MAG: hypothetical protein OXU20_18540 [Myxococcales bacterium]|nr:hypothetical protein [Myxococcales bacterium]